MSPAWIGVDWGTSNMRAWAMDADGAVIDSGRSDRGMAALKPEQFEPALVEVIGGWLDGRCDVVCCGMVGARQGWREADYVAVPARPGAGGAVEAPVQDRRLRVFILPGMSQADPPDVMRGEETQIAGLVAARPGWDGVICLPGTHSKWVEISAGEVVSFRTYMTGELFGFLATGSVLRHSVAGEGWDDNAFSAAIDETLSRPERLAAGLFGIRASGLLRGDDAGTARARLSGLLIGAELAGARPYWLGREIVIIGADMLADRYRQALAAQGAPARREDATSMTLAGLAAAWRKLKGLQ